MLRNYFLSALRLMRKERLYVLINALGLAVGLATCFVIATWVHHEISYDSHFAEGSRIYRVTTITDDGGGEGMASTYPMVRARVLSQFPEVEQSARMFDNGFLGSKTRVAHGDRVFTDLKFFYGDSSIISLFGFTILAGDQHALTRPNTLLLTQSTAGKLFGDLDPIGKVVRIGGERDMEVTAVIKDLPPNTHFHFDLMASMTSHPWIRSAEESLWSGVVFHTYLKLRAGSNAPLLEAKMKSLLENFPNDPNRFGREIDLRLQPIQSIHLHSDLKFELEPNGSVVYVYLFVTIGFLVLAVAMMNYVNLATARHFQRFKEVGVRKVLGAAPGQLVVQFLVESALVMGMAFAGALLLAESVRPLLLTISGNDLFGGSFLQPDLLLISALIALLIGLATALIPAVALSGFRPVFLFRPSSEGLRGPGLRKVLLVAQFVISLVLTFCTAITWRQLEFLRHAPLGYTRDHVIVLDVSLPGVKENVRAIKDAFRPLAGVVGAAASSQLPTDIQTGENIDTSPSQSQGVYCLSVDPDFFSVMHVPLALSDSRLGTLEPSDSLNRFVLNKQALDALGWTPEEAVGRAIRIRHGNQVPGPVLGVTEDFHFQSLHNPVGPLVIEFNPESYQYLLVRVQPDRLSETLDEMRMVWSRLAGGAPFDYQFLDEQYDRMYRAERQSGSLFIVFSSIALFISLLGLFGLASFTLERRTKEIGLRKILGATDWRVTALVSRDFFTLLLLAFGLALPLGYWFQEQWLSQFAYRVDMGVWLFLASGLLNMALAGIVLLHHSLRIARTNPVEALRWE